jgi:osmoprotectant transport system permease protein
MSFLDPAPGTASGAVRALAYAAEGPPGNPWFSWRYVRDNSDTILAALREHTLLTAESVALAALIAIPLAILAYWYRPLTGPILAVSGVLYTIPSLALFAFIAPYTGIGSRTVIIGLVLYALLMIVRNTLAGLTQVPEEVRDAAQGMGYGRFARLLRIDLPLALPGIITGVRLATVSTVALATVGLIVGHGGLGQLIIGGFRNNFYRAEIATGTVLCVALALVLDLVLASVGRLLTPWIRRGLR